MKILSGRCQLLGDSISALTIATYHRKNYPNAQIIWPLAKKCSQLAPFLISHPDIDKIHIFDGQEGPESKRDFDMMNSCDIIINPNPSHPDHQYPGMHNIYYESWRMAGLSKEQWDSLILDEQTPKLIKWWKQEPIYKKVISIFPCAGYGKENKRNPSKPWYLELVSKLEELGYTIWQFGHPDDFKIVDRHTDMTAESYFEQIKLSLQSDLVIGTDSGSGLIIAAYEANQVSLLTDHWSNTNNPYALAPKNKNNINFFASGGCDNISIDAVIEHIKKTL